ncbi:MAG: hypothetical protein GKR94_25185 [Gammaproteobacteria bacterium]|nr:hypothetical protein [Gammaproteobacteria bacterium]
MKRQTPLLMAAIAGFATPPALARVPGMSCTEPALPASKPETSEAIAVFSKTASAYQNCLMSYVDARKRDAKAYGDAANKAVNAWHAFVRTTNRLNSK